MPDRDAILLNVARLMWEHDITIEEFYTALGVDYDNILGTPIVEISAELSGIFRGWENPPPAENPK